MHVSVTPIPSRLVLLAFLGATACETRTPGATDGGAICNDTIGWFDTVDPQRSVERIVSTYCHECHGAGIRYGAPMSLASYDHTQKQGVVTKDKKVFELMAAKVGAKMMPPSSMPQPTDAERATLLAWAAAGAPKSRCGSDQPKHEHGSDGGTDGGVLPPPEDGFTVRAPNYAVKAAADDYRCWSFKIDTGGKKKHAIRFAPVIDNAEFVHHIILYKSLDGKFPDSAQCFGAAGNSVMIYGWAPGSKEMVTPPEAGFAVLDGEQYILQVHYHNQHGGTGNDSSGMNVYWTDKLRANDAAVIALGNLGFTIPQGQSSAEVAGQCIVPSFIAPITVFGTFPHMHTYGRKIWVDLKRAGATTDFVRVDKYDFNSQQFIPTKNEIRGSDALTTHCIYDTTGAPGPVSSGEGTADEMCFVFVMGYPDIGVPGCF